MLNIPLGHLKTIMPITQMGREAFNSNEVRETNGFCAFARPWHGLKKWLYYNLFFFFFLQKSMTYQMGISVVLRHLSSKSMNSSEKGLQGRLSDHKKPKITPNETFAATLTTLAHAGTLPTHSARQPVLLKMNAVQLKYALITNPCPAWVTLSAADWYIQCSSRSCSSSDL